MRVSVDVPGTAQIKTSLSAAQGAGPAPLPDPRTDSSTMIDPHARPFASCTGAMRYFSIVSFSGGHLLLQVVAGLRVLWTWTQRECWQETRRGAARPGSRHPKGMILVRDPL
jgi:hypothetical protein